MMPICDIAFMTGKLKHTNEIYVHLGDSYFVQRTAHECQPIIKRRIEKIGGDLDNCKREMEKQLDIKDLFSGRVEDQKDDKEQTGEQKPGGIPPTKFNKEGFLEINEPYPDSDEEGKTPSLVKPAPSKPKQQEVQQKKPPQ